SGSGGEGWLYSPAEIGGRQGAEAAGLIVDADVRLCAVPLECRGFGRGFFLQAPASVIQAVFKQCRYVT
ncbi:MAG: hypothetical protein ABW049_10675, partial [Spongiibacteraceae bacterium]